MKAESLLVENVPDPLAGEQVSICYQSIDLYYFYSEYHFLYNFDQTWPTEAEMAEAESTNRERKSVKIKKSVPRGISEYQVW